MPEGRRGGRQELAHGTGRGEVKCGTGHSPGSVLTYRTLSTLLSFEVFLRPEKVGQK